MDMTKSEAVKIFGSQVALAKALGVSKQAVCNWKNDKLPEKQRLRLKWEILPKMDAEKSEHA